MNCKAAPDEIARKEGAHYADATAPEVGTSPGRRAGGLRGTIHISLAAIGAAAVLPPVLCPYAEREEEASEVLPREGGIGRGAGKLFFTRRQ